MIFATVGSDRPFDRMICALAQWARLNPAHKIIAQVAHGLRPDPLICFDYLAPSDFRQRCADSTVVVSHAGMGTVLTCLELRKPVILVPRRTAYQEHTSDHQNATADRLRTFAGIHVATDELEMTDILNKGTVFDSFTTDGRSDRSVKLVQHIKEFILQN